MPGKVVGTVVGVTNPREFYFSVTPGAVQLQDLVCVDMRPEKSEVGDTEASGQDEKPVRVWAKVVDIERINPLFPEEAAQELSTQRLSAFDTVISLSREMITAKCTILGKEEQRGENVELSPLTYPLQPASSVYLGEPKTVEKLLIGNVPKYRRLKIGHLRGRPEFPAYLDGHAIVARHLAVLATTGAGKTVTVRKILEELALNTQYPILIFDPHSDYIGLGELSELKDKDRVTIYFPALHLAEEEVDRIIMLVRDLSREDISGPQESLLKDLVELVQENWVTKNGWLWDDKQKQWMQGNNGWRDQGVIHSLICPHARRPYCLNFLSHHFFCLQEVLDTLERIYDTQKEDTKKKLEEEGRDSILRSLRTSHTPVSRQLGKAASAYKRIRSMNQARLRGLQTRVLPKPSEMGEIIQKGKISIVSLEGYSAHATAVDKSSIVANLMRQLFDLRLEEKIPKFLTVVEEAHNFVPSSSEIQVPSREILRQVATEGRKYGMGLIFISQRPSRVDATVLSQCNSFIILKIINPADQKYVRDVVETLGEDDAKLLPDLATGEALITGECVRFPILAKVEMPHSRGRHEEEDFIKDFVDAQATNAGTSPSQPQQRSDQSTLFS